ncbi:hypothetical protein BS78_05G036100 [Paspalum vaginatum]|nr:hypothetical protein BS78_05G036100 [Paspalum vaginatum]KAJ1274092.1 hypothetical protein BS78_05G036100 [Paspalum vaginatum]
MAAMDTQEPPRSPTVAMGLAEADATMVVATSHGDCEKLKDLVHKQDPTTMLVVMASCKLQASPTEKSSRASMHPLVAAAACRGNLEELRFLLNRGRQSQTRMASGPEAGVTNILKQLNPTSTPDISQEFLNQATAYSWGNTTNTTSAMGQQATDAADVEQGGTNAVGGVTVEGDTVLHLVAANGEAQNFLDCADFSIHGLEKELLSKENNNGDTPLHFAARAGGTKMVSHLIALARARGDRIVRQLLRKVNKREETALHEAVRIGDGNIVKNLLEADRELACFPRNGGTSPLYLAISLGRHKTAKTLHDESGNGLLSYSGPNGQNALHAAVLQRPVLTRMVLEWNTNKDLTTKKDKNGRTPLHYAAGLLPVSQLSACSQALASIWGRQSVFSEVFNANTAAVYEPDNDGLYPIHVSASAGATDAIALIVKRNRSLAWILNMQDNNGNTALHLAVQDGSLRMFAALFGDRNVNLNLTNTKGETPLDISRYKLTRGTTFYYQTSEGTIYFALDFARALRSPYHRDHYYRHQNRGQQIDIEEKEMENMKDSTQSLCVGSVLIATVTFGATFTLPGGFIADDHANGGTPTLAPRYAFDAFMMANTLAFILSSAATVLLLRSGSPYPSIRSRSLFKNIAVKLVDVSVTCLVGAFALAVYVVLGPVARRTATAACVLSAIVVICNHADLWVPFAILEWAFFARYGTHPSLLMLLMWPFALVAPVMLFAFWPVLFSLLWAYFGRHNPIAVLKSFLGTLLHPLLS